MGRWLNSFENTKKHLPNHPCSLSFVMNLPSSLKAMHITIILSLCSCNVMTTNPWTNHLFLAISHAHRKALLRSNASRSCGTFCYSNPLYKHTLCDTHRPQIVTVAPKHCNAFGTTISLEATSQTAGLIISLPVRNQTHFNWWHISPQHSRNEEADLGEDNSFMDLSNGNSKSMDSFN